MLWRICCAWPRYIAADDTDVTHAQSNSIMLSCQKQNFKLQKLLSLLRWWKPSSWTSLVSPSPFHFITFLPGEGIPQQTKYAVLIRINNGQYVELAERMQHIRVAHAIYYTKCTSSCQNVQHQPISYFSWYFKNQIT